MYLFQAEPPSPQDSLTCSQQAQESSNQLSQYDVTIDLCNDRPAEGISRDRNREMPWIHDEMLTKRERSLERREERLENRRRERVASDKQQLSAEDKSDNLLKLIADSDQQLEALKNSRGAEILLLCIRQSVSEKAGIVRLTDETQVKGLHEHAAVEEQDLSSRDVELETKPTLLTLEDLVRI